MGLQGHHDRDSMQRQVQREDHHHCHFDEGDPEISVCTGTCISTRVHVHVYVFKSLQKVAGQRREDT